MRTPTRRRRLTRFRWKAEKRRKREERRNSPDKNTGRGGKPGHKGRTRRFTNPEKRQHHKILNCPKCGSDHIKQVGVHKKCVAAIPKPSPFFVLEHIYGMFECQSCHTKTDTGSNAINGFYDATVVCEIMYMYRRHNMTFAGIRQYMNSMHELDMKESTIQNIIRRGTERLKLLVGHIENDLMNSKYVGIDETSARIEDMKGWAWVIRTYRSVLVRIENSRGGNTLKRIFGKYTGTIVSDRYQPYASVFAENDRQWCCAHLIRESKGLKERKIKGSIWLYGDFAALFKDATQWSSGKHTQKERNIMADRYTKKTREIAEKYAKYGGDMEKFGNKLRTASANIFTFVRQPGVPPTNNGTEQSIRQPVMWRKVHGQLRSKKGMEVLGDIMSCFMTWRLRGQNPMEELARHI